MKAIAIYAILLSSLLNCHAFVTWIASSGSWNDAENWSNGQVPGIASDVHLNLTEAQIINIDVAAKVHKLTLISGMLSLYSGGSLAVDNLVFISGTIAAAQSNGLSSPAVYSTVNIYGNSEFSTTGRKRLRYVTFTQRNASLTWSAGDIVLLNSTLKIDPSANFTIASANSSLRLISDHSERFFKPYWGRVLNTEVDLITQLPPTQGVYDIITPQSVYVSLRTGPSGRTTYPLAVRDDEHATAYYAYHVNNSHFGYRLPLYNRTLQGLDEHQCADACRIYGAWCKSFDYLFFNRSCSLSALSASFVGGLTAASQRVEAYSYPLAHFEKRLQEHPIDSYLVAEGAVEMGCELADCAVTIAAKVSAHQLVISDHLTVSFTDQVSLLSEAMVSPLSALVMQGVNASLLLDSTATLTTAYASATHQPLLWLHGGLHELYGNLSDAFDVAIDSTSAVDISLVNNATFSAVSLLIADQAVVSLSAPMVHLFAHNVTIQDEAMLVGATVNISASVLTVGQGALISVQGGGYGNTNSSFRGPAGGSDHSLGASGGGHGGRGGPAKVDAAGQAYGSTVHPRQAGSAGGIGYHRGMLSTGSGGGVLVISVGELFLDGDLSADGNAGDAGGGGGAGGSIAIYCTTINGTGLLTAVGGKGGFSGGLIAGGGGAGGRIAIHASAFAYNGSLAVHGGLLATTYDLPNAEQAGAGTVYVKDSTFTAVMTADQKVAGGDSLRNRMPYDAASAVPVTSIFRGAYVLNAGDELSDNPCDLDIHVIGTSPLMLAGESYCLGNIIGSGQQAAVHVINNAVLSMTSNPWPLTSDAQVHLKNVSFVQPAAVNMTVSAGAQLHLHLNDGTLGASSLRSVWTMHSLTVGDAGSLYFPNASSVFNASALLLLSGGKLATNHGLELHATQMTVNNAAFHSITGQQALVTCKADTTMNITTALSLIDIELNLEGISTWHQLSITGMNSEIVLHNASATSVPTTVSVDVPVIAQSNALITIAGRLQLSSGGHSGSAHFSTTSTGSLVITGKSYEFMDGTNLDGLGSVNAESGGEIVPPSYLGVSTAGLYARDGGSIFLRANHTHSTAATLYNITCPVFIETDGALLIAPDTTSAFYHLHLAGGKLYLQSEHSELDVHGFDSVISGGEVIGPGVLRVADASTLTLAPHYFLATSSPSGAPTYIPSAAPSRLPTFSPSTTDTLEPSVDPSMAPSFSPSFAPSLEDDTDPPSLFPTFSPSYDETDPPSYSPTMSMNPSVSPTISPSQSPTVTPSDAPSRTPSVQPTLSPTGSWTIAFVSFLQTQVVVNGTLVSADNVINWAQHATVRNYGTIRALGNQQWTYNESLFAFERPLYCLRDAPSEDAPLMMQMAVEECAYACVYGSITLTTMVEAQRLYQDDYPCESFVYNTFIPACKLLRSRLDGNDLCASFGNGEKYSYKIYNKVSAWTVKPQITNFGVVLVDTHARVDIALGMANHGTMKVEGEGKLTLRSGFEQSIGAYAWSDGSLLIGGDADNIVSGMLLGAGNITFFHDASLTTVLESIRIEDPALTLIVEDRTAIATNFSTAHVKNWFVDGGQLIISNHSFTMTVEDQLLVSSSGVLQTADFVTSDGCSACFDLAVTAKHIDVQTSGTIDVSKAFIQAKNITVQSTASISCSGRGYSNNHTTFPAPDLSGSYHFLGSGGGGHAGIGGRGYRDFALEDFSIFSEQLEYGNFSLASTWGFPGGSWETSTDTKGGGLMKLAANWINIEGALECNGQSPVDSMAGGGAGGSIHVEAGSITGTGIIQASGGAGGQSTSLIMGHGGGGGGGRISLFVDSVNSFVGTLSAKGGNGHQKGSAGTVFLLNSTAMTGGHLTVANLDDSESTSSELATILSMTNAYGPLSSFTVKSGSRVIVKTGAVFSTGPLLGDSSGGAIIVTNATTLIPYDSAGVAHRAAISGVQVTIADALFDATVADVGLGGTLALTPSGGSSVLGSGQYTLSKMSVNGTVVFDYTTASPLMSVSSLNGHSSELVALNSTVFIVGSTGHVHSDGEGYPGSNSYQTGGCSLVDNGAGCGSYGAQGGGGGSYGGAGGYGINVRSGSNYGTLDQPVHFGSGGGGTFPSLRGGTGGGIVKLFSKNMVLNGQVTANGMDGAGAGTGGGSGGSIWIQTNHLTGSGSIIAHGGNGLYSSGFFGGSGSGGRVAVHCDDCFQGSSAAGTFTGQASAHGGDSSVVTAAFSVFQLPSRGDRGLSATDWLKANIQRSTAGSVLFVVGTSSIKRYLIVKNTANVFINVPQCFDVSGVETCSSVPYTMSEGCSVISESSLIVEEIWLASYGHLCMLTGTGVSTTLVTSDSTSSVTIEQGAALSFPSSVSLAFGKLSIYGTMQGAGNMTLSQGAQLYLSPNASWSYSQGASYTKDSFIYGSRALGVFNTSSLRLLGGSSIHIVGGKDYLNSRAVIVCDDLRIDSTSFITTSGAGFPFVGRGETAATSALMHPAGQASGNITYGDGGWHAGRGGGFYYNYPASGNAFYPVSFGAAGGSTYQVPGSSGGGAIHIIAKNRMHVNGMILADGLDCKSTIVSSAAGAGAGGSIWLEVLEGDIIGSGTVAARGGDGCLSGGGAGSGGRVAIYAGHNASSIFSSFHGLLNVSSGVQNPNRHDMGQSPQSPAGGTIYLGTGDRSTGFLLATNHGRSSAPIYALDGCSYMNSLQDLGTIVITDAQLVIDQGCQYALVTGISPITDFAPLSAMIKVTSSAGQLDVKDDTLVVLDQPLALHDSAVYFHDASSMFFHENLTIAANTTLGVSTIGTKLVGTSSTVLSNWKSSNGASALETSIPVTFTDDSLSYLRLSELHIAASGKLQFTSTSKVGWENSNLIEADVLMIAAGGLVDATGVLLNPKLDWDLIDSTASNYSYFGTHAGKKFAATGGGHAGPGLPGTDSMSVATARGDLLYPLGPGGAGGGDISKDITGGGGGGGLLFQIKDRMTVDGIIDVSGGSAVLGSSAAGGAGGSILIDSPAAVFNGTGILRSNGGNGSVSAVSTWHSGAGSAGAIAVRACQDAFSGDTEALGGLTLLVPASLQQSLTTDVYISLLGLSTLANVQQYRSTQELSAAASGVVTRYAGSCLAGDTSALYSHPYLLNSISSTSYSLARLHQDSSALISNVVSSLQFGSVASITSIIVCPTTLTLPTINNISAIQTDSLSVQSAKLNVDGAGTLQATAVAGNTLGMLTMQADVDLLITSRPVILSNLTVNITDNSRFVGWGDLYVQDGARLLLFNHNMSDDSYAFPDGMAKLDYIRSNLTFSEIHLSNDARIAGSRLFLFANKVSLVSNSTITADAAGYYGGDGGEVPSEGAGAGSGQIGFVGGDGGGYGGLGLASIDRLHRNMNADQYLGLTNAQPFLDDSLLALATLNSSRYGSLYSPIDMGSGGGGTPGRTGRGGRGGGAIVLYTKWDVTIDSSCSISANGESIYGGGGGGSGGSVWIRHSTGSAVQASNPDVIYKGHIVGGGKIHATGGATCPIASCAHDIDHPGGAGGGGRVRIEKRMEFFSGTVSVLSGLGSNTAQLLETQRMGTFLRVPAISTLVYNRSEGEEVMDIKMTETPIYLVQTITTDGAGTGNRSANTSIDAIVKGEWMIGYRYQAANTLPLSSQASAQDVKDALQSLDNADLDDISVSRRPSVNGWIWSITFYSALDRIAPLQADGRMLWCTAGVASIHVHTVNLLQVTPAEDDMTASDAPAVYSSTTLAQRVRFNRNITGNASIGFWLNYRTFRVIPRISANPTFIQDNLPVYTNDLQLIDLFPIPTAMGYVSSLSNPYLQTDYNPDWKFPTTQPSSQPSTQPSLQPSRQPSDQPSMQPSGQPSAQPSGQPSMQPSHQPTAQPSEQPSGQPSTQPTISPTAQPSMQPTGSPTGQPSGQPSMQPSAQPSMQPSRQPSLQPSMQPTGQPSGQPTDSPTSQPSMQPSAQPSSLPSAQPSVQPSSQPSAQPSGQPSSQPSGSPTGQPTEQPSMQPSMQPSVQPSSSPSTQPSSQPSGQPSMQPSVQPSAQPSGSPTGQPTMQPSNQPSAQPSMQPSGSPTGQPSMQPSMQPSGQPSMQPSSQPSSSPTGQPSAQPSIQPSTQPSAQPTSQPSTQPSRSPTGQPSGQPSMQPSIQPTSRPTSQPSNQPSASPTNQPTMQPSSSPSMQPSAQPSAQPAGRPTSQPSRQPTSRPTMQPSSQPTMRPSRQPTSQPSRQPSRQPSSQPSRQPFGRPTGQPSAQPAGRPTGQPSRQPTMQPSSQPVIRPTSIPSSQPSMQPSSQPVVKPTSQPSAQPAGRPTGQPSNQPSMQPSAQPVMRPTGIPSGQPSGQPSAQPVLNPTTPPTAQPTTQPSAQPVMQPTAQPSAQPLSAPSGFPTGQPTGSPTTQPSMQPSGRPTSQPTMAPSGQPSNQPTGEPTGQPSEQPSGVPSTQPSSLPTNPTSQPTSAPSNPTSQPTSNPSGPTSQPSTQPSNQPSMVPTSQPTQQPSTPTTQPSRQPTTQPSSQPSAYPSRGPAAQPTAVPTTQPTRQPSMSPTSQPTSSPSAQPTDQPSMSPSSQPTSHPTAQPRGQPTSQPSAQPVVWPTSVPSAQPSMQPSAQPVIHPTSKPSCQPSASPSTQPSNQPTASPSSQPSMQPSHQPDAQPSSRPSTQPSAQPSSGPTCQPSMSPTTPTAQPSSAPSGLPTCQPSGQPSAQPVLHPTSVPSTQPSAEPSSQPSTQPTDSPSRQPSVQPSSRPSCQPTSSPTGQPSSQPTGIPSSQPSAGPTGQPSVQPSRSPSTQPSEQPSAQPAGKPTSQPSDQPTGHPTTQPTAQPSVQPSTQPVLNPTSVPTTQPSLQPSVQPSEQPSSQPSLNPASAPSGQPSQQPSTQPSAQPSVSPTDQPSCSPTMQPSSSPSTQPSVQPSVQPSKQPVGAPTSQPSSQPSEQPTSDPTAQPSMQPSLQPVSSPTSSPSGQPSEQPSGVPSGQPTMQPSSQPSAQPVTKPTSFPSSQPSGQPSGQPSNQPTGSPSGQPTGQPLMQPSAQPSRQPAVNPTTAPTSQPSMQPTVQPSAQPSDSPTAQPSAQPSEQPVVTPSSRPSNQPSGQPSTQPSAQPSMQPTVQPSLAPSGTPSAQPSEQPSSQPSTQPSGQPVLKPTSRPSSQPSEQPSVQPSAQPSSSPTGQPTEQPSIQPSTQPSAQPVVDPTTAPSSQPSMQPFGQPSGQPSEQPSADPTTQPSAQPVMNPTSLPSSQPSEQPSRQPSQQPSSSPTAQPSVQPAGQPTGQPSDQPVLTPTSRPTMQPSDQPYSQPSVQPTSRPSTQPSQQPSASPTAQPSEQPSVQPSSQPSAQPVLKPTSMPSGQPSEQPSLQPSDQPTGSPTAQPSERPSSQPTMQPSTQPVIYPTARPSMQPSEQPSGQPTDQPSLQPVMEPTAHPSCQPSAQPSSSPTSQPSEQPSSQPSTQPSNQPVLKPTSRPSSQPSEQPSQQPSAQPSSSPSGQPTEQPNAQPTTQPSAQPVLKPTSKPSDQPSAQPSMQPSNQPTGSPTGQPSEQPSMQPSAQPSTQPVMTPTGQPLAQPTRQPTEQPSAQPTGSPTAQPSEQPSVQPSSQPSMQPVLKPTSKPSDQPSGQPSMQPSHQPTGSPTGQPSSQPSQQPSAQPSSQPVLKPTSKPSDQPSAQPSMQPSNQPTGSPTGQPSEQPTMQPSGQPTVQPSTQPTGSPTGQPSEQPSVQPSTQPSSQPVLKPTSKPTDQPSEQPSMQPTTQPTGAPTGQPSDQPSEQPSEQPSTQPTDQPTGPSAQPSEQPSNSPTGQPSGQPSEQPSKQPTSNPTKSQSPTVDPDP